jgi:UDP-N-acetylmuramoyl-tripeptide--D-alanyl-D-alanine ligase
MVRVEDSIDYLVAEATAKVRRLRPDIVAITGSYGKTTTKMAILAVLSEAFEVVASEGNKNTPLGLSLLLLNRDFDGDTKLVLEMGARLPRDLDELCSYFPPTVSVITVVRGVHIETFGSIEGVQQEKAALVRALGPGGTACLNADDPRVLAMADVNRGRTLTYGTGPDCAIRPDRITVELPTLGEPALYAALAAFSAGVALGMDDATINRGLSKMKPEKGRLNKLRGRGGSTLLDDTYNASPEPTLAALHTLEGVVAERRIAFLGDMLELGPTEVEDHASVLAQAVEMVDHVHAVGPLMAQALERLDDAQRARITLHETSNAVADALRAGDLLTPGPGDAFLVKGSQGRRMERISEALLHPDVDPADVLPRQSTSWKQIA